MLRATLQQAVPLQALAADGRTDLYARAELFDGAVSIGIFPLPHLAGGLYGSTHVPSAEGYLTAVFSFFEDAGYTIPAYYDLGAETIEVSSDKTNIMRILGLLHENSVVDLQTYNVNGDLLTARVRAYDSKPNALTAGLTGLRYTWSVVAVYNLTGELIKYGITREL